MRKRLLDSVDRIEHGQAPVGAGTDARSIEAIDAAAPSNGHWRTLAPGHKVDVAA
jgi:hypothetical protein